MNDAMDATDRARLDDEASIESALRSLAEAAGITTVWQDYRGVTHTVGIPTLHALLKSLGLPATTLDEIAESRRQVASEAAGQTGDGIAPLVTAPVGAPIALPTGLLWEGRVVSDRARRRRGPHRPLPRPRARDASSRSSTSAITVSRSTAPTRRSRSRSRRCAATRSRTRCPTPAAIAASGRGDSPHSCTASRRTATAGSVISARSRTLATRAATARRVGARDQPGPRDVLGRPDSLQPVRSVEPPARERVVRRPATRCSATTRSKRPCAPAGPTTR